MCSDQFTSFMDSQRCDLKGIWTGIFVIQHDSLQVRVSYEEFLSFLLLQTNLNSRDRSLM